MPNLLKLLVLRSTCAIILFLSPLSLQAKVPVVEAPPVVEVEFGKPFEYTIKASNEPIGYSVSGLPFWMKREGPVLNGTPVVKAQSVVILHALNEEGLSVPKRVIFRVVEPASLIKNTPKSASPTTSTEHLVPCAL